MAKLQRSGGAGVGSARSPPPARVALEVDGPTHYMWNAANKATGLTSSRNALLHVAGWHVVSLKSRDLP